MSEENVERLKAALEAFNRKDFDAVVEIAHPEIEFVRAGGQSPLRGAEAFRAWMEPEAFQEQTFEPIDFRVNGNKVLVHARAWARGAGSGIDIEFDSCAVWTFDDDGRLTRVELFLPHEEDRALEAAGLSE